MGDRYLKEMEEQTKNAADDLENCGNVKLPRRAAGDAVTKRSDGEAAAGRLYRAGWRYQRRREISALAVTKRAAILLKRIAWRPGGKRR